TLPVEYGLWLAQENKGVMKNNGFEFTLGSRKYVNEDFEFGISGNLSYAKNKMIEVFQSDAQENNPNRTLTGKPFGTQFGYQSLGLFSTEHDKNGDGVIDKFDGYNVEQFGVIHPGDIMYADLSGPDGVPDGKIDVNDETEIGYPVYPLLTFGLTADAKWRGFDVTLFFQGSAMSSLNIKGFQTVPFENNASNTSYEYFNNRWTVDHQNALYPRATPSPYVNNDRNSSFWMVNTSFLRLKTATVGYTLPESLTNKVDIGSVRVHYTGVNLLTLSGLDFLDPEMGYAQRETAYPVMQNHTFGITVNF
ncbi:MAG: SusC/RagA family TonB-linked outer membrane protein, partial [Bacteroidota bacterium]